MFPSLSSAKCLQTHSPITELRSTGWKKAFPSLNFHTIPCYIQLPLASQCTELTHFATGKAFSDFNITQMTKKKMISSKTPA